jgi:hypothetical protein
MLRKEILDTLRIFLMSLSVAAATIVFSLLVLEMGGHQGVTFNELLCYLLEIILLLIALYLGSSLFAEEKNQDSFEYLFSLRLGRWQILAYKLLPRVAALLAYLAIYGLFAAAFARYPLLLKPPVFVPLFLAIFFFFSSLSLLHRNNILNIVYNSFIFLSLFLIILSITNVLAGSFHSYSSLLDRLTLARVSLHVFFLISVVFFLGFVFTFKKVDLSNMSYRFLKKYIGRIGLVLLGLLLVWLVINRFDAGDNPQAFTTEDLRPATFDADNGFYRLCTLLEPPAVDVESPEIILKYRRYHDSRCDNEKYLKDWQKLTFEPFLDSPKGSSGHYPWLNFPDETSLWNDYILKNRRKIILNRDRFDMLLHRYRRLIDSPVFEDFSRLNYRSPIPNLLAWLRVARIYIGMNMLDALDGNWQQGAAAILDQVDFCKRAVRGSRILITNLIGKAVLRMSLQALASLMAHPDCPRQVFSQVLDGLPDITYEEFGTRNCFITEYLIWDRYVEADIYQEYNKWSEGILLHLFMQKNRTKKYVFDVMSAAVDNEERLPYRREGGWSWKYEDIDREALGGWLWWVQNPVGKVILESNALTNYSTIVLKSYYAKALYDMTKISAEFRLNHSPEKPVQDTLNSLETYRTLLDPCSGKPYIYNSEKQILYSLGTDLDDDGGKGERITSTDTDFVLPLILPPNH